MTCSEKGSWRECDLSRAQNPTFDLDLVLGLQVSLELVPVGVYLEERTGLA